MPDSSISRFARTRQQTRLARKAWGAFLTEFLWSWFGTLTFRDRISRETAWRTCHAYLCNIQNANSPLGWFVVEGRGRLLGRLHFHFLLAGTPNIGPRECEQAWFRLGGTAVIVEYDNQLGGAHYCAGHLDEDGLEYHFSDNLSAFRAPTNSTDTRKIDETSPYPVVCRNGVRLSIQRDTLPHCAVHAGTTSIHLSRAGGEEDCVEQKRDVKAYNEEQEGDDEGHNRNEARNSTANRSTRWTDSSGGTNMRGQRALTSLALEAAELDEQLKAQWAGVKAAIGAVKKVSIRFGKLCEEIRAKELHKYVRKPGSRKSFVSFAEYICDRTDGEVSKGTIYVAIELYRLTQGPNALTEEDVAGMPVQNACLLGRLKPEQRTPDIVEAAKKTSKREFPAKIQAKLNEYLPAEQQRTPRVDFFSQAPSESCEQTGRNDRAVYAFTSSTR
jgi:hypothetical protein